MLSDIKVVFLDVDNTLLDFNENAKLSLKLSMKEHGLEYKDGYFSVFKSINDKLWKDVEKKVITRDKLHEIRFNLIFKELGISFDGKVLEKTFLNTLNRCTVFVDGAMELVKYLSKKYILCSASNAPYVQQIERLTNSGIMPYLKHTFISQELGVNKPDPRFFIKALERLDIKDKSKMVMIGDSLSADILGGINFGIKTVWFNFEKLEPPYKVKPDYIVNKLKEIEEIL